MKRIHPHYTGNVSHGWAFDVEDDSKLSDATPLSTVIKLMMKYSGGPLDFCQPFKAVVSGRTLLAVSPWYVCTDCGQIMLEYWNRPHRALSGKLYCGPCATKACVQDAMQAQHRIFEKKQRQMTLVK